MDASASPLLPAATAHDHAGVLVLTNRTLWSLIVDCMSGYPRAVVDFAHNFKPPQVYDRFSSSPSNQKYHLIYWFRDLWFKHQRVLPDLAVAANNPAMFRLLYKLAQQPSYRDDPRLRLTKVMRCAVLCNQVGMLECITAMEAHSDDTRPWEITKLMRIALYRPDPDLKVVEWVYTHIPRTLDPISGHDLRLHVDRGDLELVKWLCERRCKVTQRLVNAAASCGHAHVLRYLYEQSGKRCAFWAIHKVVENGDMAVLNVIFDKQKVDLRGSALSSAAEFGRMEIATLLVESVPGVVTHWALERAARYGRLDVLKYLLANFEGECTSQLMKEAAAFGHLETVKYLHESRSEGCSRDAIDRAAWKGHLEVVAFLHDKYGLKCSRAAVSKPVTSRRSEILAFLQTNDMLED